MVGTGAANSPIITDASNAIEINNQEGYQALDYAATITPDPYLGARIHVAAMTGNITVNATTNHYAGLRMSFEFLQDGTGGRTITFNAQYKTTWTPSKTASKYDCIEFRHDGAYWIEINSTVGVG